MAQSGLKLLVLLRRRRVGIELGFHAPIIDHLGEEYGRRDTSNVANAYSIAPVPAGNRARSKRSRTCFTNASSSGDSNGFRPSRSSDSKNDCAVSIRIAPCLERP